MAGTLNLTFSYAPTGTAFDTDYQAILDEAGVQGYALPSSAQQIVQNQLMIDIKASGEFAKRDVIFVFANDASTSDFALINWKDPTGNKASLVNSPAFISNQGFEGDNSSAYINTNYTYSGGSHWQLDDASNSYYLYTAFTDDTITGFVVSGSNRIRLNAAGTVARVNSTSNFSGGSVDLLETGFSNINRVSSTDLTLQIAGTTYNRTNTSSAVITAETPVLLRSITIYSQGIISYYSTGASTVSEYAATKTAIDTYMASL